MGNCLDFKGPIEKSMERLGRLVESEEFSAAMVKFPFKCIAYVRKYFSGEKVTDDVKTFSNKLLSSDSSIIQNN